MSKETAEDKIRAWFESNPGECATSEELATKFDTHPEHACRVVRHLVREGTLKGAYTYCLNTERER